MPHPQEVPTFDIPEDYQTHSSFNTLEKQHRVRRSPSPQGPSGIAYAQMDLAQPVTGGVRGSGENVQYSHVAPYEAGSPTSFQYFPQDQPLARPGGGGKTGHGVGDWVDAPHYANTVV